MPVLMMVGSEDTTTPVGHQQIFFDALTCRKELHIIKNALHSFKEPNHLEETYQILANWLDILEK